MERTWNDYESPLSWAQSPHRPNPPSTKVRVKIPNQDGNEGTGQSS